jgi:hypothetical protein
MTLSTNRWLVPLLFVALGIATAVATADSGESAAATVGKVAVTVSPDRGLIDGRLVTIRAEAPDGLDMSELRAHLCKHRAGINSSARFDLGSPYCVDRAIGGGQFDQAVELAPGSLVAGLSFAAGVGSATWVDVQGKTQSLTCGSGSQCDLVVQVKIPNKTVYAAFPLSFAGSANSTPPPVASTTPGASSEASGASTTAAASRDERVFAAGVAGLIGGVLITLIVSRARRRSQVIRAV